METKDHPSQSSMLLSVRRVNGRANLSLSNGETLAMPRAMLKERPYRGGTPFDATAHQAFMRERAPAYALQKAVALLAVRARTEHEIVNLLRRSAYPETAITSAMQKLHHAGYLNDGDFAQQWTASRIHKGMGIRRIRQELRMKGISEQDIESVVDHIDERMLDEGILHAARKAARGRNLSLPDERRKVMAALARRGFDYQSSRRALEELLTESE